MIVLPQNMRIIHQPVNLQMHRGMIMIEAGIAEAVMANLDLLLEEVAPMVVVDIRITKMTVVIVKKGNTILVTMLLSTEIRTTGDNGHGAVMWTLEKGAREAIIAHSGIVSQ